MAYLKHELHFYTRQTYALNIFKGNQTADFVVEVLNLSIMYMLHEIIKEGLHFS